MIFCEKTAEQLGLGIADFGAVVAIFSGRNDLDTRTKPGDALKGTSNASKAARQVFGKTKFPLGIRLPTWIGGYTPWTTRRIMVRNVGTFVGRTIPLVGVIVLSADVVEITYKTVREYNTIARRDDKIW